MSRGKLPTTPYRLICVDWHDSCSHGDAWKIVKDLDDLDFTPTMHVSIGWEIKRTDRALTLAPNLGCIGDDHNHCASGLFTIPLVNVDREVVLSAPMNCSNAKT